jgi:hypothetical protein
MQNQSPNRESNAFLALASLFSPADPLKFEVNSKKSQKFALSFSLTASLILSLQSQ